MITIEYIKNLEINDEIIFQICSLKKQHWEYSIDEQIEWIKKNIKDNDVHLLLWKEKEIVAYSNIVELNVKDDDLHYSMLGIGNVCVDKNHLKKSYGYLLMKIIDHYLYSERKTGLLLCKDNLIPFYTKMQWNIFEGPAFIENTPLNSNLLSSKNIMFEKIFIDRYF